MRKFMVLALALILVLALATPAFAVVSGSDGAGLEFGTHHSEHARDMGGFTGVENPGVMHKGFSGWPESP